MENDRHRLVELDALRGLAALLVVVFHLTTRYQQIYIHRQPLFIDAPWGAYGVNLFFALSGFVIFMTLERTHRPLDFIVSRFSRLFPAYWVAMAITTIVVWIGGMTELEVPIRTWVLNIPMIQDAFGVPSVDGVYWTLAVEIAFYCCMFALYLCGALRRIEYVLVAWIALKWLWWQFPGLPYLPGFFLLEKYIPFFAIGICAYRLYTGSIRTRWAAGLITFSLVTEFVIDGATMGVVACLVTAVFLLFVTNHARWLRERPLAWLGSISYTLYLLHENIGWTILKHLEALGVESHVAVLAALVSVLGVASIVTVFVERPAMHWIRGKYKALSVAKPVDVPAGAR